MASPLIVLLVVTAAAILLDLFLLWTWRYVRSRQATGEPQPPRPPPEPVSAVFARIERFGRAVGRGLASGARLLREEALSDERRQLRTVTYLACLFLSASIGYAYADSIMVEGWQLWTWLLACVVAVVVLIPSGAGRLHWSRDAWIVVGLTLAGALLRLTALDRIPPGLHGDEGRLAEFTLVHVYPEAGLTLAPFRAGLYSQPTLYNYVIWLSMRLAGQNLVGLRLASAIAGTLAIPMTYFAVSQFSARRVALFSAALMAAYHYHIQWSRLSLNNIWDTVWIPAVLGCFAWGWRRDWAGGAVLCGIALGLSQYFYAGSKLALFLLPLVAYTLWRDGRDSRRLLIFSGKALAAALVIAAPILLFAAVDPEIYTERWNIVFFWNDIASSGFVPIGLGWWDAIRDQAFHAIAGFTSFTDRTGFYRAGVPLVMGLAAPLFLAGMVWAAIQRQFIPVVWIVLTMILGGFVVSATPSSSHFVPAIPAIAWVIALLLDGVWRHIRPWLAVALLLAIVASDLAYYFGVYVPSGSPGDFHLPFPG